MRRVARKLGVALGRDTVLFDEFVRNKVLGPDARVRLVGMFRDDVDLAVAVVDEHYLNREWCRAEWRAIVQRIRRGRAVLLVRCADVTPPDWPQDGWALDGRGMDAESLAESILSRLHEVERAPSQSRRRVSLALGAVALFATLGLTPSIVSASFASSTDNEPTPRAVATETPIELPPPARSDELLAYHVAEWSRVERALTRQERAEVARDWAAVEAAASRGAIGPTLVAVKHLNQRLAGLEAERAAAHRRLARGRGEHAAPAPIPRIHQFVVANDGPRLPGVPQPVAPRQPPHDETRRGRDPVAASRVLVTRRSSTGLLAGATLEPDQALAPRESTIFDVVSGDAQMLLLVHDPESGGAWPIAAADAAPSRCSFVLPLPPAAFGKLRVYVVLCGDRPGYAELTDLPLGVPSACPLRPLPGT